MPKKPALSPQSPGSNSGSVFVVSAPSGAGKTTLCKALLEASPDLQLSVSYTTRPMRAGEKDGVDYHFVDIADFEKRIEEGEFAEWARVHGNYYGTSIRRLEEMSRSGKDILLDIDYQGAAQLKKCLDNGVYIFIMPPDFAVLQQRLEKRNSDPEEVIIRRIENARQEVLEAKWYDYIVVNDNFDFALQQLKAILSAESCRTTLILPAMQDMLN
ncbi:MAG: guanylate kinase [Desulfuromonas sp.]|nr:MAG: guanylate kinase [Desulfuromonas sp.]